MSSIGENVKRPVPVLGRDNWRTWFKEFEYWMIGEGIDFAITKTLYDYAKDDNSRATPSTASETTEQPENISNITRGFAMFNIKLDDEIGAILNPSKRQLHRAANAKILFMLSKCISVFDRQFVENHTTAKDQWEALKAKYSKMSPAAKREDLLRITGFKYGYEDGRSVQTDIQSAWAYLVSVKGKIATADPKLASTFDESTLFEYLLAGLPESFNTIQQTIESSLIHDTYEKLEILERGERKYNLGANPAESAQAAQATRDLTRPAGQIKNRGKRRDSHKIECYFCGQEHYRSKCELRDQLMIMMSEFKISKSKSKARETKRLFDKKHDKGLAADEDKSDKASTGPSTPEQSDEEENCHFSKDQIPCKIPKSDWCSDSGCTKHMTDNPNLFRGAMVPIQRRVVKVGGGKLYADYMGQAEMRVNGDSLLLDNVLYVPGLGHNLLSSRKLCTDWNSLGVFNDKSMWFISENKQVVLQANVKGGLYIVSRIIPGKQGIESAMIGMLNDLDEIRREPVLPLQTEVCCHTGLAADVEDIHMHDNEDHGLRKLSWNENLARYRLMHRRFAHLGPEKLRSLHKVTTLERPIVIPVDREMCRVCKLTKLRNKTNKVLSPWKESILALVSIDVAGPFLPTIRGNKFFAQIVDNSTRKTWTLVDKTKSALMTQIRKWKATEERRTQLRLGAVRSDNASEIREMLDEWSREGVIEESTTSYTGSHQNGIAERSIQQAETDGRAMLKEADLPLEFWDWAVEADTYIRNRTSSGPLIDGVRMSPEEAYTEEKPSVDHIRVFGSVCYSYVSPKSMPAGTKSKKLLDSGAEGVFVGYNNETTKQLNIYRPDLGYATMSSVVEVDESKQGGSLDLKIRGEQAQGTPASQFTTQGTASSLPPRKPAGRPRFEEPVSLVPRLPTVRNNFDIVISKSTPTKTIPTVGISASGPKTSETKVVNPEKPSDTSGGGLHGGVDLTRPAGEMNVPQPQRTTRSSTAQDQSDVPLQESFPIVLDKPVPTALGEPNQPNQEHPPKHRQDDTNSDRAAKRLKAFLARQEAEIHALIARRIYELEEDAKEAAFIAAGGTVDITIPMTYEDAVSDPTHGNSWENAIHDEIDALVANKTWQEEKAPRGANLVSTKWVFTTKTNADGSLERFKARLVARGFSQIHGEDYDQTFAPTVRTDTLRIFLAMVAANDLECRQYDVKNAFTESSLKERIYLSPPKGVNVTPGLQLRVLRSLYGLKQSARDWNTLCKNELKRMGFEQSLADPCLYTHNDKEIALLVYVDDLAAAAKDKSALSWFYEQFSCRFNTKDLGEISKILGMRITRRRQRRELFIDQEQYLEKILQRIGLPMESSSKAKPRPTPVSGKYDKLEPAKEDEERGDKAKYQRDIGSIMYAMVYTRPDIAFHIGQLSQQLRDPTVRHQSAVKELGRYLRSTIAQKIRYGPTGKESGPTKGACLKFYDPDMLSLYSDADWANMKDRKSISGYVAMLFNGPVAYGSRKQRSVSTSSCEAEYIGMSTCCKQGQWIAQVLRDMGFSKYIGSNPTTVEMMADNQGAIALAKNPHLHERSKHIDISYHYIRDLEEQKRIKINYVPTTEMIADGFTKPLDRVAFERFKTILGLVNDTLA
jgi:Reverse transcriptase (RNA-dependent DNA polymerase)/gag-polypeptide of LTR copia-type